MRTPTGIEDGKPYDADGFILPTAAMLPKTHFPSDGGWILVRNAGPDNLPAVDQEILFVNDIRGTQSGEHHLMFPTIFTKPVVPEVRHGYVSAVGYHDELQDWWIEVCDMPNNNRRGHTIGHPDDVTYWKPMPAPPTDNYVKSPYCSSEVWDIIQAELIAKGN